VILPDWAWYLYPHDFRCPVIRNAGVQRGLLSVTGVAPARRTAANRQSAAERNFCGDRFVGAWLGDLNNGDLRGGV
jgi:hypothetical protein